jgi:hypothetical protein
LAALILVSSDDLLLLDFLTGARIVRPERDASCRANSFRLILDVVRSQPRPRSLGDILFEAGWEEVTGVDGVTRIFGYVPSSLPPRDFFLSIGEAKAEAFAAVNSATWRDGALILAGLVGSICIAWAGRNLVFGIAASRSADSFWAARKPCCTGRAGGRDGHSQDGAARRHRQCDRGADRGGDAGRLTISDLIH